jgi:hypothetical protein
MRRIAVFWVLFLLTVATALLAGSCAPPEPQPEEDSATAAALTHVKARLMAGESARFRNLHFVDGTLCGEVAALNAAKDYTGWRRFAVQGTVARIAPNDSLPTDCR